MFLSTTFFLTKILISSPRFQWTALIKRKEGHTLQKQIRMHPRFVFFLLFCAGYSSGQSPVDTLLAGTWKGRSICQVRLSPCHDEVAVYHISKTGGENNYHVLMNKIVKDHEESMAAYVYRYENSTQTLTAFDENHHLTWHFQVKGKNMEGTLVRGDTVFRIIHLQKTWQDP